LFNPRIFYKLLDLSVVFAAFFTPLLFFIKSHDQFELPKLTFLVILSIPLLLSSFGEKKHPHWTPLTITLLLLLGMETISSLPAFSLSWRTSFLGEYENFSGLVTFLTFLIWFWVLSGFLNEARIEKIFYFNSLAAFLSSFYAIGQHFQWDFIQWNPESVNATREFAALGNPNFLSAYLAMSIPLYLCVSFKDFASRSGKINWPRPFIWVLGVLGVLLLFLATPRGLFLSHLSFNEFFSVSVRGFGLFFFSIACVRFSQVRFLPFPFLGIALLTFGLLSTASRGGFLGAFLGIMVWLFLALSQKEWGGRIRQTIADLWKNNSVSLSLLVCLALVSFIIFGGPFFHRLLSSILNFKESLATSRLHIWRPALQIIKANPVLGVGLDNFKIAFPYYSGVEFGQIDGMFMSSRMAHNELLQMGATTGLLGLAAYLAVLSAFGFMWWKSYRTAGPPTQWLLVAILASAVAYHIQNFFSFGVATLNFLWFFFLAAVQFYYRKSSEKASFSADSNGFLNYFQKTVIFLLIILILYFPFRRLGADIAYSRGSAASDLLKNHDPQTSPSELIFYSDFQINHLLQAVDLCPLDVKYRLYLGLAYEQRAQVDSNHSKEWSLKALECYEKAVEMSPANAYYYNDESRIDNNLSRLDPSYLGKAEEASRNSVKWAPSSPFFILSWALSLEKLGKTREAQDQFEQAFKLDPYFSADTLSKMAQEEYRLGDKAAAFHHLDQAIRSNTSCAEAYYRRGLLYLNENENKKALTDFETVKNFDPSPEKNPSIQYLDILMEKAKNH
jgi:O-antigen ligase